MGMGQSPKGRRRDRYMQAWPLGRQLEAMQDQLAELTAAVEAKLRRPVQSPKWSKLQADFAAIRLAVDEEEMAGDA